MNNNRNLAVSFLPLLAAITLFLFHSANIFCQSKTDRAFLLISPSAQADAMGETYGNLTSNSPMAIAFNPASLGFFAQNNYFGIFYYPREISPLPTFAREGVNYNAKITAIGFNLKTISVIPVSFGIAFNNSHTNWGGYPVDLAGPGGSTGPDQWQTYDGITWSIALDYYIKASFGYTRKSYESKLEPVNLDLSDDPKKGNAHDIGFLLEVPVLKTLRDAGVTRSLTVKNLNPFLNLGYYYSKRNIGGEAQYSSWGITDDVLPRVLSLGVNLSLGVTYNSRFNDFTAFSFRWAREADDMLVRYSVGSRLEYVSGASDIKFWDNVFLGRSNDKIVSKKGYEINIGDFYFFRRGNYKDIENLINFRTKGWGVDFLQPFKIVMELLHVKDNIFLNVFSRISFEEHYAKYDAGGNEGLYDAEFRNYVFRMENLPINALIKPFR